MKANDIKSAIQKMLKHHTLHVCLISKLFIHMQPLHIMLRKNSNYNLKL